MSSHRSINKENEKRLSSFGQRLQSLSDTFYSSILEDSKEQRPLIKNARELEHLRISECDDFTFNECSISQVTSNDNFSFTFHSLEQPKLQKTRKHQSTRTNHSSTPYSIREENSRKKCEDETVMVEENRSHPVQPVIIGYYPVISYQPVCLPPTIYLSNQQIQSQINDCSTLTKVTPMKKL
ncbi:unnamed protein product [Adineta steineri]|uniref:Uncharacterized protein n=1 Tax=Adineta steineri TaxID=433720 RepID=A0A814SFL4_9BILA|nr:unnamed protein product [Adineta steineri]CAF1216308.1 unnamed protein product [Adineta steineri]CAF3953871.1 unnamed protein product [Adineta steineri]CAF4003981.1 unnamed protein product [Adineta steineri]